MDLNWESLLTRFVWITIVESLLKFAGLSDTEAILE